MADTPNITIPYKLLDDKTIADEYKLFYGYIYFYCGVNGYMWHENEKLSELTGNSLRTIGRALKALEDGCYIVRKRAVKEGDLYEAKHNRVVWIYDNYHGAIARAKKNKQEQNTDKGITLRVFKKLIKKYYPNSNTIYTLGDSDYKTYGSMHRGSLSLEAGTDYLQCNHTNLNGVDAKFYWDMLHKIYLEDTTLFPVLFEAEKQAKENK